MEYKFIQRKILRNVQLSRALGICSGFRKREPILLESLPLTKNHSGAEIVARTEDGALAYLRGIDQLQAGKWELRVD